MDSFSYKAVKIGTTNPFLLLILALANMSGLV